MLNDEPYKDTKPEFGHIYVLSNGNFWHASFASTTYINAHYEKQMMQIEKNCTEEIKISKNIKPPDLEATEITKFNNICSSIIILALSYQGLLHLLLLKLYIWKNIYPTQKRKWDLNMSFLKTQYYNTKHKAMCA
jgi:hypothetical protein